MFLEFDKTESMLISLVPNFVTIALSLSDLDGEESEL